MVETLETNHFDTKLSNHWCNCRGKSETRKQTGTFLMGKREISIAIKGGYKRKRYCFT
jgi:hypothetical protein